LIRRGIAAACLTLLVGCEAVLGVGDTPLETKRVESKGGEAGAAGGAADAGSSGEPSAGGAAAARQTDGRSAAGAVSDTAAGSLLASGGEPAAAQGGASGLAGATLWGESDSAGEAGSSGNPGDVPGATGGSAAEWPGTSTDRVFRVKHPWPRESLGLCVTFELGARREQLTTFWQHAQDLISDTWLRAADIPLSFQGECGPQAAQVQVQLTEVAPSGALDFGYPGEGRQSQVILNASTSDADVLYFIGQVLGFEHEFGRDPYAGPCHACQTSAQCVDPSRSQCLATGYCGAPKDHESIMSAPDCGGLDPTRRFSRWDALGAQRAYGRKMSGLMVGKSDLCWDVPNDSKQVGTQVIGYPCRNGENERWKWTAAPGRAFAHLGVSPQMQPLCARAPGDALPLLTANCDDDDPAQQAVLSDVQLLAEGGLCVAAVRVGEGSQLWVTECGTDNQLEHWTLIEQRIQLAGTNLCITVPDGEAAVGGALELEACDASSLLQVFAFEQGELRFYDDGGDVACFNVLGGQPLPGEMLALWNGCGYGLENEAFVARGTALLHGLCVDFVDSPPGPGARIGTAACTGAATQIWDYHF
jgi:hypothetical protein